MFTVIIVIGSLTIMEDREEPYHINICTSFIRKEKSVIFHLPPMLGTMNLRNIRSSLKNMSHKTRKVYLELLICLQVIHCKL